MKLQRRFLIFTAIVFGLSACTSTSIERTSDATAVSASTTNVYSESSLTSSSTVYFSYDNYNIDSIGSDKIKNLAAIVKKNGLNVRVEGHCDERGTREYNLALGERRANAIAELLIINGVSKANIMTVSYGEEKPSARGSNESSWSKNRRALIKTF
ncbi:MAG: OmpA family protein [SAR86 cluster bacterium]|jgi:peptidoglycan-associated lipoprotein|nr:OmpA family protein [Gammaproteobacteria bacterium]MDG2456599.1 OmpA family protein [SAR86 cluster bacterium]|tara:strand:+ start:373 stop:840 length:468 start_codon:yes stop_codon:yes gene_type:complete